MHLNMSQGRWDKTTLTVLERCDVKRGVFIWDFQRTMQLLGDACRMQLCQQPTEPKGPPKENQLIEPNLWNRTTLHQKFDRTEPMELNPGPCKGKLIEPNL